jgi:hypothetical protein
MITVWIMGAGFVSSLLVFLHQSKLTTGGRASVEIPTTESHQVAPSPKRRKTTKAQAKEKVAIAYSIPM